MKKSKKLISLVVAAVMALGIVLAPMFAMAQDSPTVGGKEWGVFRITSTKEKTIRMVGTTAAGKKKAPWFVVVSKYKLDKSYYDVYRTEYYTVTRIAKDAFKGTTCVAVSLPTTIEKIDAGAFNGSKAKLVSIKADIAPKAAVGMLKGSKAAKVTIKVPKAQVAAWKKAAKAGKLGIAGSKIVVKAR